MGRWFQIDVPIRRVFVFQPKILTAALLTSTIFKFVSRSTVPSAIVVMRLRHSKKLGIEGKSKKK